MAMVIAMFFLVLSVGIVFAGTVSQTHHKRIQEVTQRVRGQATVVAESGIIDCLDFLRRQSTQPVKVFQPKVDLLSNPPIQDTEDADIGLVRSFEIGGGVWGRYEVRKYVPNVVGDIPEMLDVSAERGVSGAGAVWRIVSRAYIYRNANSGEAYNQLPNMVLAQMILEVEARRLTFAPPAQAGIAASRGQSITISHFGRVTGGTSSGVAYPTGTGKPGGSGTVTGTPAESILTTWNDSPEAIFGVSEEVLRSMSNQVISSMAEFPDRCPTNQLIFVDTNLAFDSSKPLKGTAILYIKGDLTIAPKSSSLFNGIIYVTGKTVIAAPATINGTIIALGDINLIGTGDWAEVIYDDSVIHSLMLDIGQYRKSTATHPHDLRGTLKR